MIDPGRVTSLLRQENLSDVKEFRNQIWTVSFAIGSESRVAMLMLPRLDSEYFIAFSLIAPDAPGLEGLPAPALRELIRIQSDSILAKIRYIDSEGGGAYFAVSECSVDNVSGKKLRRRLEACAKLAASVDAALAELRTEKQSASD